MHSLCPSLPAPVLGGQAPQGYMILGKFSSADTVAILAQGTHWAVAPAQAYLNAPCWRLQFQLQK